MSSVSDLKDAVNIKMLSFVLLSLATAGLYPIMWMYKNTALITLITKKRVLSSAFVIWIAVAIGIGLTLFNASEAIMFSLILLDIEESAFDISELMFDAVPLVSFLYDAAVVLMFISLVMEIVWCFKMKAALQEYALNEHKIDLSMNWFYTLIFAFFYINYCINELAELKPNQEVASGESPQSLQE